MASLEDFRRYKGFPAFVLAVRYSLAGVDRHLDHSLASPCAIQPFLQVTKLPAGSLVPSSGRLSDRALMSTTLS